MEIGNFVFGNARGEFRLEERRSLEAEMVRLLEAMGADYYGMEFENDVFSMFPYYWGECTCGGEEANEECNPSCKLRRDNFVHKPSGLAIQWYKYPLRDAYGNQDVSIHFFRRVIDDCMESLKKSTR